MQLKIAAPVAKGLRRRLILGQIHISKQPVLQLRRRDRCEDGRAGNFLTASKPNARDPTIAHQNPLDIGIHPDLPALFSDQLGESLCRLACATFGDGGARGFQRKGDDLGHLAGISAVRGKPAMQHPRGEQGLHVGALEITFQPTPCGRQGLAEPCRQPTQPALAGLREEQFERGPRP